MIKLIKDFYRFGGYANARSVIDKILKDYENRRLAKLWQKIQDGKIINIKTFFTILVDFTGIDYCGDWIGIRLLGFGISFDRRGKRPGHLIHIVSIGKWDLRWLPCVWLP